MRNTDWLMKRANAVGSHKQCSGGNATRLSFRGEYGVVVSHSEDLLALDLDVSNLLLGLDHLFDHTVTRLLVGEVLGGVVACDGPALVTGVCRRAIHSANLQGVLCRRRRRERENEVKWHVRLTRKGP